MGSMRMETHVEAPAEDIFAMMTDMGGVVQHISGIDSIEVLTEGPMGVGTRFRETRTMMGKPATEEMEVVAFEPGRSYTLGCSSFGSRFQTVISFTPEGTGTRVAMEMSWKPVTLAAKLMSPVGAMMKGMMRKCMEQDLADIKKAAESGVTA